MTYGAMQTQIADELARDDLSTSITAAIQAAIKQFEGQRFDFNVKRYQILTVASQEFYEIEEPTLLDQDGDALEDGEKLLEIDGIMLTVTGQGPYPLSERGVPWFRDRVNSVTRTGDPTDYTMQGQMLRLYPVPTRVATLNIDALGRLPTLADSSDTNAWMEDGEPLIRSFAKLIVYRDVVRDLEGARLMGLAVYGSPEFAGEDGFLSALQRKMAANAYLGSQPAHM